MAYVVLSVCLIGILYPYLLYPFALWLISRATRRRETGSMNGGIYPRVSVIVAAHNEEKVIADKIENTLALRYPKEHLEVLIGSDGSEDGTDDICRHYQDKIMFTRIEPRQGKANVLNTLVPKATGEILLFSDANTVLEPDVLEKMHHYFYDQTIGAVCGRLELKAQTQDLVSFESQYWKYETTIKRLGSEIYSTIGSNGGIYAMRRDLYQPIPNDTIIDDFWISITVLEQGKRISFEKEAVGYEEVSENIIDEFWRKVRIGGGNIQTLIRKPFIQKHKHPFINIFYYSHKVIRWMIPLLIIPFYVSILQLSTQPIFLAGFYLFNLSILIALIGTMLDIRLRMINMISYFFTFNFALLLGYLRYLTGKQRVLWRRAKR